MQDRENDKIPSALLQPSVRSAHLLHQVGEQADCAFQFWRPMPVGLLRAAPQSRARLIQALEDVAANAAGAGNDLGAEKLNKTLEMLDGLPADTTSSMQARHHGWPSF
ncbi:MAG TPA: hypothetical protein VLO30_05215 [Chthoniobacterales bacterium]|nr:hypothetical protein [Chthoniobacterales bacterium]